VKVLGIAGSPRRGGNTDILLEEALRGAAGRGAEVETVVLNDLDIAPCQHCDACFKKGVCRIKDDMQMVYGKLEEADGVVLSFPVQFLGPPAPVKAMIDRGQALWARKYLLKIPPLGDERHRKGLLLCVGGMKLPHLFDPSLMIVKAWFRVLDIEYAGELTFRNVDEKGAITKHPDALAQAFAAGQKLAE